MKKIDYFYDYNEDNLYIYKDIKSYGSLEFGDSIILDVDKNLDIIAIEFLNASKIISTLTGNKVTKKVLSNLKEAKIQTQKSGQIMITTFKLKISETEFIEDKISIPNIKYKSPVLARI
jgi:uncharacterized protein YuzE